MSSLLIDTNIYTLAFKGDSQVISTLQRASRIALTAISLGELLSGFKGGNQEQKNRAELEEFLDAPRVDLYGVTENTAEFYAEILNRLKKAGTPIPTNDIWLAAVAFEHGFRLYSRDRHFQYVQGLILIL